MNSLRLPPLDRTIGCFREQRTAHLQCLCYANGRHAMPSHQSFFSTFSGSSPEQMALIQNQSMPPSTKGDPNVMAKPLDDPVANLTMRLRFSLITEAVVPS